MKATRAVCRSHHTRHEQTTHDTKAVGSSVHEEPALVQWEQKLLCQICTVLGRVLHYQSQSGENEGGDHPPPETPGENPAREQNSQIPQRGNIDTLTKINIIARLLFPDLQGEQRKPNVSEPEEEGELTAEPHRS
ncbi:hypothetical protein PR048_011827 [Dryococelus australis]|uniref:Uncharacterized protein n=1 Tax=Dryococelus australis TaxID=614101 RepID=A0ABQ9HMN3_9NEOP|nr:hypothetical protein PR048_011827 [Dryococelus australis]